jgi:hypothetical protein
MGILLLLALNSKIYIVIIHFICFNNGRPAQDLCEEINYLFINFRSAEILKLFIGSLEISSENQLILR